MAARGAETFCTIAYGSDDLAKALGVGVPSFVVANREPHVPWALLSPPMTQQAVEVLITLMSLITLPPSFSTCSRRP